MNKVILLKNKVYEINDYEALTCDVYLPNTNKDAYPVAIFLHGGSFHTGSKELYQEWGNFLASNDIIAISINYTLATPTRPSYQYVLENINNAIKYVVINASEWQADPYNIALIGDSAGGYLACLGALKLAGASYKIKACIPVYGVFDLVDWDIYTDKTRKDKVVKKFLGANRELNNTLYQEMNIFNMLKQAKLDPHFHAKFLIIYGSKDEVVLPQLHSLKLITELKNHDIYHNIIEEKDFGHFWFTPINEGRLLETEPTNRVCYQVLDFLNDAFKNKETYDIHLYEV